ncbi:MAG: hypothetical protein M1832_002772 [Thelocarpon impressellum]|nr:MAG: hypothetical protein M1832_002772 [Thelocarpon impressellum]
MDDLAGLEWSSKPGGAPTDSKHPSTTSTSFYQPLRPTPSPSLSGTSTPLSTQASGSAAKTASGARASSKLATPASDSFSHLVSFSAAKNTDNLSLQERQKQLQEEKAREQAERNKAFDAQFGGQQSGFWDTLGGNDKAGRQTAAPGGSANASRGNASQGDGAADDDLLSAFSAVAPVSTASNFPPLSATPSSATPSKINTPVPQTGKATQDGPSGTAPGTGRLAPEDDLFGLGPLEPRPTRDAQAPLPAADDDDILGLLGKPVSELPRPRVDSPAAPRDEADEAGQSDSAERGDKAVAELVDMGFPLDRAREALAETNTGQDVQAAVGWLLTEAHRTSKEKSGRAAPGRARDDDDGHPRRNGSGTSHGRRKADGVDGGAMPAWMRPQSDSAQGRDHSQSPVNGDKDIGKLATEVGSTLFKSANSLWTTGRKKVQRAVTELQYDSDPNQPKWMREGQLEGSASQQQSRQRSGSRPGQGGAQRGSAPREVQDLAVAPQQGSITDEALMLESGGARPPPRKQDRPAEVDARLAGPRQSSSRDQSPAFSDAPSSGGNVAAQKRRDESPRNQEPFARGRLSRQAVEEQTSQAYVSPARRKKPPAKPVVAEPSQPPEERGGVEPAPRNTTTPTLPSKNPFRERPHQASLATAARHASPTPTRARQAPRQIPPVSSHALSSSASHRLKGTEAFKRGDYSSAHASYSRALGPLPERHPVVIVILCNRALVNLKVGDPKAAVADADDVLSIIGASKGEGEKVALGADEGERDMRDYYGKALMRKAEALEQVEKWAEAGRIWKDAVEAGFGGATSIQGRSRCEKAAGGGGGSQARAPAARRPAPAKRAPPPKKASALRDLSGGRPTVSTASSAEAVVRLRQANAAAELADDEKFALADSVDAKLSGWKGGKQDNLRALLGSLEAVLWPEAGWKKVGMHELVLANKVKVVYMRGIAKVHPDKVSCAVVVRRVWLMSGVKLPTTATTEQKMISGAVFSTLNEAWDKFKKENGL